MKHYLNVFLLLIAFFLTALSSSCSFLSSLPLNSKAQQKVLEKPRSLNSDNPYDLYLIELKEDFRRKDFATIEQKAETARTKKERFEGGAWKIKALYEAFEQPLNNSTNEEEWKQHFAILEKWKNNRPTSVTAGLALSQALLTYAEQARGLGNSNTVSRNDWRLFDERLKLAEDQLDEVARLADKCPVYYHQLLILGLWRSWGYERFDKVFRDAVAFEPQYQYYYRQKAVYLLPRWHGKPGEWEQFADETMNALGGKDGVEMYYQIVSNMSRHHGSSFFQKNKVSWIKTKEGFAEFERRYGMSKEKLNEFGRMAMFAGDTEAACQTFKRISENDFDGTVWESKESFEFYRNGALVGCKALETSIK